MLKRFFSRLKKRITLSEKFVPVTEAFLFSEECEALMSEHLPFPGVYDKHEAQNQTRNYLFRHHEVNHRLGVFRWRGIFQRRQRIIDAITGDNKIVVDLGGAAGPLGFNAIVVDFLEEDAYGQPVRHRHLREVGKEVDVVFTSHTLEHIPELEEVINEVRQALKTEGLFLVHIPSFYCERWRAGIHSNKKYNDHFWTFGLAGSEIPEGLKNYLEIDVLLGKYFEIELAEYSGDDSIFIYCVKK